MANAPWTIKGFPTETRLRVIAAAKAQDMSVAEWLTGVVNEVIDRRSGTTVYQMGKPGKPDMTEDQRTARMQAVAAMMQGLAAVKQATGRASGRDIVMQEVWALDRGEPRRPRGQQTNGQTTLQIEVTGDE